MTLLNSTPEKIESILAGMAAESEALTKEAAEICWFMRGSVSWDQAMRLTPKEKAIIRNLIKDRIEQSEKAGVSII